MASLQRDTVLEVEAEEVEAGASQGAGAEVATRRGGGIVTRTRWREIERPHVEIDHYFCSGPSYVDDLKPHIRGRLDRLAAGLSSSAMVAWPRNCNGQRLLAREKSK